GAGAEMRRTLGVAVFSGMLGVTLFGIFLTPVFFYVIEWFMERPLFSSARMRQVGKVLLFVVGIGTLGLPWVLVWLLGRALRRRGAVRPGPKQPPVRLRTPARGTRVPTPARGTPALGGLVKGSNGAADHGRGQENGNGQDQAGNVAEKPAGH